MKTASVAFVLLCVACHGAASSPPAAESTVSAPEPSAPPVPSVSAAPSSSFWIGTEGMDGSAPATIAADAGPGPCGPTKLTVDDKPMSVTSARAYGFASLAGAYVVVISNKAVSCKDLVKGSRVIARDETYVEVGTGPNATAQQYLNSGNTLVNVSTDLVKKPKNVGDAIEICVRDPRDLVPGLGPQKKIAVSGLVKGTYCGDVK